MLDRGANQFLDGGHNMHSLLYLVLHGDRSFRLLQASLNELYHLGPCLLRVGLVATVIVGKARSASEFASQDCFVRSCKLRVIFSDRIVGLRPEPAWQGRGIRHVGNGLWRTWVRGGRN